MPRGGEPMALVATVAGHGLPGSPARWPTTPLSRKDFADLLRACGDHGLHALLGAAVDDGALPTTTDQRARVEGNLVSRLAQDLRVERRAVEVLAALRALRVDHRLLKGVAVAHLDYPDPSLRSTNDVDVLIPAEALIDVVRALEPSFGPRDLPERRAEFDRRFAKDVTLTAGVQVDLHRTLATGPFGHAIDLDALWDLSEGFQLGEQEARALQPVDRLLNAAYTSVVGEPRPRLSVLRDIAQQLARGDVDPEAVVRRARAFQAVPVLAAAFTQVTGQLGVPTPEVPVHPSDPTRWLGWYLSRRGTSASEWLGATMAIPGLDGKVAYLRALAWPDREYRRARRERGRRREWAEGLRQVARRARERR